MKKLLLGLSLLVLPLVITAQENVQIQQNQLDSLYLSWAEDRLFIPIELLSSEALQQADTIASSEISDSVYRDRLDRIPSVMELTYNKQVKRFIELYTVKRKNQTALLLGLADYYFPLFEEVLMDMDMPIELKYMPVIESGLNPVATSRVGAQGLWQFMYRTAKGYGLEMNSYVDERWDPLKSTRAAVTYLQDLFEIYGDWHLVIAAYNCGPGNVNKAIRRSGGKRNYWEIYYHLPKETRGYVPAFISVVYAMNYHHAHGIAAAEVDFPVLVDTVWVKQDIHLKQVSEVMGLSYNEVRKLNPQYRRQIIPGNSGQYALQLPLKESLNFVDLVDSVASYKRSTYFSKANLNKVPTFSSYTPGPPKGDYATLHYTIKSGDNLGFIAEWYDVGLSKLKYWNNVYNNTIRAGKKLTIYVAKKDKAKYDKIDQLSFEEKQKLEGKVVQVKKKAPAASVDGSYEYYTVKNGDNLYTIAKKYPGISNSDIMSLNGMEKASLKPGQQLKIRKK